MEERISAVAEPHKANIVFEVPTKDTVLEINTRKLANTSDFGNLRVSKIYTSKRFQIRIILVSQTFGNDILVVSPVCKRKKSY